MWNVRFAWVRVLPCYLLNVECEIYKDTSNFLLSLNVICKICKGMSNSLLSFKCGMKDLQGQE